MSGVRCPDTWHRAPDTALEESNLSTLAQDIRYAIRSLTRAPGFTALAIATLAIGIGANTTIFSAVRAVLLRPLPYPEPQELIQGTWIWRGDTGTAYSPSDFTDLRRENSTLSGLAAMNGVSYALTEEGDAEQIPAGAVSGDFFPVLGARALHGRTLLPSDDVPQARVAVLGHALWTRRFGADPALVGRTIRLDGEAYEVVGIMPAGFAFPEQSEVWTPIGFTPEALSNQRGAHYLDVIGRLKPGVTLAQAQADLTTLATRLAATYPQTNRETTASATPLREAIAGDARPAMRLLLGAVTLVLVLACVNVANLLLARGVGRGRDIAIRTALGASSRRIARALVVESVVLALAGGAVGLVVAAWGSAAIAGLSAANIPLLNQTRIDGGVLIYAFGISVVTGVLFGLLPAWEAVRAPDLTSHLKNEGGASTADVSRRRVRRALVVGELALATALLAGAGLLIKSLNHLVAVDLGLDPRGVMTYRMSLPQAGYATPAARAQFVTSLTERLERIPGVIAVGGVFGMPLTGFSYGISGSELDGRALEQEEQARLTVQVRVVTPDFFETLGIPVRRGRAFTAADRAGAAPVMIVNEAAAELLWPGVESLGHRFTIGSRMQQGGERAGGEVVGVVGDVRDRGPSRRGRPTIYLPHAQYPMSFLAFALKTAGDPQALVGPARAALNELDPTIPIFRVRTLAQMTSDAVAQPRLYAVLLTIFAGTALLLAVIGVYGVMSFSVARRTRDIGVRMALGATPGGVLRLVLSEGARITGGGLALGILVAWAGTRLLRAQLYGVQPTDPLTFVAVVVLLSLVAVVACYLPARRATRIDPLVAIKSE